MKWEKKTINGITVDVLEISTIDEDEIEEIRDHYSTVSHVQISLCDLQYLDLFQHIYTLILTSGVASQTGLETLYTLRELKMLVLDYEETDSDEEGVVLDRFPVLEYVLSRSNLNIYHVEEYANNGITIDVLNTYSGGRPKRIKVVPSKDICIYRPGLFMSTEAYVPAARMIMQILNTVMNEMGDLQICKYSSQLKRISIIPICVPEEVLNNGFCKERKYVSLKRQYADIRLQIDYEVFVRAPEETKVQMCLENIEQAARYISAKDKTFDGPLFCYDIRTAMNTRHC
ncbi:MAG: hypothetical protein IK095_06065 [Oscillospiraceae bacterium]|nr:hypothetical protein [Oscillospiraceae bacterium]